MASDRTGRTSLTGSKVGAQAFHVTPFMRLARAHVASMAGNAMVVIALADSVFFTNPEDSRERLALTLAMTLVPFTLLAPLVGPWLDRLKGGRRWVIVGANAGRVVICVLMVRELETLALYPLAFLVLMLDKSYNLAKSALVPTTVSSDEELVQANSLLTRLSTIAGLAGAAPAGLATLVGKNVDAFTAGQAVLALAAVVFAAATVLGAQIPKTRVAEDRTSEEERHELRSAGILLAASAMALMRGIIGFMTFLFIFNLQEQDAPFWQYGVIVGAASVGPIIGTVIAPLMRAAGLAEQRIIQLMLGSIVAVSGVSTYLGGLTGSAIFAITAAIAAAVAKLSFDSIVQMDAPEANRGRTFARFETRFQLVQVIGAFFPVLIEIPLRIGMLSLGGVAVFALVSYITGTRAVAAGQSIEDRSLTRKLQRRVRDRKGRGGKGSGPTQVPPGVDPDATTDPGAGGTVVATAVDTRPPPPPPPPDDRPVTIDPTRLH